MALLVSWSDFLAAAFTAHFECCSGFISSGAHGTPPLFSILADSVLHGSGLWPVCLVL